MLNELVNSWYCQTEVETLALVLGFKNQLKSQRKIADWQIKRAGKEMLGVFRSTDTMIRLNVTPF